MKLTCHLMREGENLRRAESHNIRNELVMFPVWNWTWRPWNNCSRQRIQHSGWSEALLLEAQLLVLVMPQEEVLEVAGKSQRASRTATVHGVKKWRVNRPTWESSLILLILLKRWQIKAVYQARKFFFLLTTQRKRQIFIMARQQVRSSLT